MKFKYRQKKPKILQDLLDEENKKNKEKLSKKEDPKQEITLEAKKYKFYTENHMFKCDRYDKPWRDLTGDGAVYFLFQRALEQSKIIDNLRTLIKEKILKNNNITSNK